MMKCVVEVQHRQDDTAVWRDRNYPTLVVCERHRKQYDERLDLGPYDWEPIS